MTYRHKTPIRDKTVCEHCECLYTLPVGFYKNYARMVAESRYRYNTGSVDYPTVPRTGKPVRLANEAECHDILIHGDPDHGVQPLPCPACAPGVVYDYLAGTGIDLSFLGVALDGEDPSSREVGWRRQDALADMAFGLTEERERRREVRDKRRKYRAIPKDGEDPRARRRAVAAARRRAETAAARGAAVRARGLGEDGRAPSNWRLGLSAGDRFDCLSGCGNRLTYFRDVHHSCVVCVSEAGLWEDKPVKAAPDGEAETAQAVKTCRSCDEMFYYTKRVGRPGRPPAQCEPCKRKSSRKRVRAIVQSARTALPTSECVDCGDTFEVSSLRGRPCSRCSVCAALAVEAERQARAAQRAADAEAARVLAERTLAAYLETVPKPGPGERACVECHHPFTVARKPGRPAIRCPRCRGL